MDIPISVRDKGYFGGIWRFGSLAGLVLILAVFLLKAAPAKATSSFIVNGPYNSTRIISGQVQTTSQDPVYNFSYADPTPGAEYALNPITSYSGIPRVFINEVEQATSVVNQFIYFTLNSNTPTNTDVVMVVRTYSSPSSQTVLYETSPRLIHTSTANPEFFGCVISQIKVPTMRVAPSLAPVGPCAFQPVTAGTTLVLTGSAFALPTAQVVAAATIDSVPQSGVTAVASTASPVTWTLTLPISSSTQSGTREIRLVINGFKMWTFQVTVTGGPVPGPSVSASPSSVKSGDIIHASWNSVNSPAVGNFIALYPNAQATCSQDVSSYRSYVNSANGTADVSTPSTLTPGSNYEIRFYRTGSSSFGDFNKCFLVATFPVAITLPSCSIPLTGDFTTTNSCDITGSVTAPGNVIVMPGHVITVNANSTFIVDLKNKKLLVKKGGGVLVKKTGAIKNH